MFDIFNADLDLRHPKVVSRVSIIQENLWNHLCSETDEYTPEIKHVLYRKLMFGKLLYFFLHPNKIENKITVLLRNGEIENVHPGQGRLFCYYQLGYETIPIIGIQTLNQKYPDYLKNVSKDNLNILLSSENKWNPYWVISEPGHPKMLDEGKFQKERLLTINRILKKHKLLNLNFYHKEKFICNMFVNQRAPEASVVIEDSQGYINFCKWLCGLSTSTDKFAIQRK